MKKIIILAITVLGFTLATAAQTGGESISVESSKVEFSGDKVSVVLDLSVGACVARSGHTVVYRPCLTDGTSRWTLPELVVEHRRGRIARNREDWASGKEITYDNPVFARNGQRVKYSVTVPYQSWMEGARLIAESIDVGCCSSSRVASVVIAENPASGAASTPQPVVGSAVYVPVVEQEPRTTGDRLAREQRFVLPVQNVEQSLPQVMFDDDREGALTVYFDQGSAVLEPFKNGNSRTLRELLAAIRSLQSSPDSRVAQVIVAGFTSPEGSSELNDNLAYDRATALKRYIEQNAGIDPGKIRIYNGAEDWAGLRALVAESNMPNRERVLDIIDGASVRDVRNSSRLESAIQRLDDGRTYRYMLRNFYPELRKAAYIKVFYDNK